MKTSARLNMHATLPVNERRHADQAAQESEQRCKRLLASVVDYAYSVTVDHDRPVATSHGPGCEAVTGYTSREFDADPFLWCRMVFSEDCPAVTARVERILGGKRLLRWSTASFARTVVPRMLPGGTPGLQ